MSSSYTKHGNRYSCPRCGVSLTIPPRLNKMLLRCSGGGVLRNCYGCDSAVIFREKKQVANDLIMTRVDCELVPLPLKKPD